MSEKLELFCPKCKKNNTANIKRGLHCKYCEEELTDKTYIKKPKYSVPIYKSFFFGIILGLVGTFALYYTLKSNRFSPKEEYILMQDCINKNNSLSGHSPEDKLKICSEEYSQTLDEKKDFKSLFQKNVANHAKL